MGWSTGSQLYTDMLPYIVKHVPDFEARKNLHKALIREFEGYDCSTMGDLLYDLDEDEQDPAYRRAWIELYGDPVTGEFPDA